MNPLWIEVPLWLGLVALAARLGFVLKRNAQLEDRLDNSRTACHTQIETIRKLQEAIVEVQTRAPKSMPVARALALSDLRFVGIWKEWPADDDRYLAVQQLLAWEILDAIDRVSDIRLAGKPEHIHAAGALECLLALTGNLDAARMRPEQWTKLGRQREEVGKLRRKN